MVNGKTEQQNRADLRRSFLEGIGWGDKDPTFLAGDASNRTYYRVTSSRGHTAVLMDAHDPSEKVREFIQIDTLLQDMGYAVPEIIASDLNDRFILLEDLGDKTFTFCLEQNHNALELYESATNVLIDLHKNFNKAHKTLPVYTLETYRRECDTLLDWYYPAVMGKSISTDARKEWEDLWQTLLTQKISLPRTLVLRDFHVDNLIWLPKRSGLQRCGLLDFQDALLGSPTYDLVSLFEDARLDVSDSMTKNLLALYFQNFPNLDQDQFMQEYNILGMQRSAKIIGYFTRLAIRDHKKRYLDFIPRTWKWVEQDLQHPVLKDMKNWMDKYIPKEKRGIPNVSS